MTAEVTSKRQTPAQRVRTGFLSEGFYKMQRDRVLEENKSLRRRVQFLETKLRRVARFSEQAMKESVYD